MRINIYAEELTAEVESATKISDNGIAYVGVRLFLESPDSLHHTKDDDDRSAITFWIKSDSKGHRNYAPIQEALINLMDVVRVIRDAD